MADPRKYLADAAATPPDPPGATSDGYPQSAVPGSNEATKPGPYWYHAMAEEARNLILAGGLLPNHTTLDQGKQVLEKLFGRTNNGDPNGVLAAHRINERCWDTSKTPAVLYFATAADGTTDGTTWQAMWAHATFAGTQFLTTDADGQLYLEDY